jgi:hypothetical protein
VSSISSELGVLEEPFTVIGGISEEESRRSSPFEVQVGIVVPSEADTAMDLDILGGRVEI